MTEYAQVQFDNLRLNASADKGSTARYGAIVETVRGLIPESRVCKLFCKGSKCKHCDYHAHAHNPLNAFRGVNSTWVTENLLAMSRPLQGAIDAYHLPKKFAEAGITMVLNLQEPFEHSHCGAGVNRHGFSYSFESFQQQGVTVCNCAWVDFGSPPMERALDIVKIMASVIQEGGKIAVHCHAGRGRTGLIIAAYLIFHNDYTAAKAIRLVRSQRPKTIQTRNQVKFLEEFDMYLHPRRAVYHHVPDETEQLTLREALERERTWLVGQNVDIYRYRSLMVDKVCTLLQQHALVKPQDVCDALMLTPRHGNEGLNEVLADMTSKVNKHEWDELEQFDALALAALLLGWLRQLREPAMTPLEVQSVVRGEPLDPAVLELLVCFKPLLSQLRASGSQEEDLLAATTMLAFALIRPDGHQAPPPAPAELQTEGSASPQAEAKRTEGEDAVGQLVTWLLDAQPCTLASLRLEHKPEQSQPQV
ncbi:uncharacterized protein MONBRDRAFT_29751 [Monosiga brevicollis MX1]|uniref:Uncharacterized protein n=1 Tax=Monosiga brevicollis TaxID=81824 RepID=A9VC08_MONBE|nr:uncharacterized protein MONBRDRAFT_29751 [Monosiga brevicollis MX1]EDQ84897.1 predicted protein [Monosiga brevicollis MX1]|eukprot:XP_001750238.1 hypothetical protein [Monosiga brevicollis MX1]